MRGRPRRAYERVTRADQLLRDTGLVTRAGVVCMGRLEGERRGEAAGDRAGVGLCCVGLGLVLGLCELLLA